MNKVLRDSFYRNLILDILKSDQCYFLSIPEIQQILKNQGYSPNKTTIYREIKKLVSLGFLVEVFDLQDVVKYEFVFKKHHHHFICLKCKKIIPLKCFNENNFLEEFFQSIEKNYDISVNIDSLDLKGYCTQCKPD